MSSLKEEVVLTKKQHSSSMIELSSHIKEVQEIKSKFEEEIKDISNIKRSIESSLLSEIKSNLNEKFSDALRRLTTNVDNYHELEKELKSTTSNVSALTKEINKLILISSSINNKDFEMEKFAKELLELDKEKLNLMRKIDTLERLVSKQRQVR